MSDRAIAEAVQQLAGVQLNDHVSFIPCTVQEVDLSTRSCTVTAIGGKAVTDLTNVQLMADVEDGLLYVPTIGSTVIVTYSKHNVPYVSLWSQLDDVMIVVGSSALEVKDQLIQLNDGVFGGLVKVIPLTAKINALENLLNDLITKFNTHTHLGVTTGSGISGITGTIETGTITPTQQAEIEDSAVKH